MTDRNLSVDNKPHELKFGASFDPKSGLAYHSIRYDFKPASVDTSQESQLEIGAGHHVTLTVPHVEGSGKTHTVFKGNKRPVSKECVLIIDHDTGTFTLERLSNNINVKKTRMEGSSKVQMTGRPVTPVEHKVRSSPSKVKSSQSPSAPIKQPSPPPATTQHQHPKLEKGFSVLGEISDSSSSDDDSSSSDSYSEPEHDTHSQPPVPMMAQQFQPPPQQPKPLLSSNNGFSSLSADLHLSDSDSDSD